MKVFSVNLTANVEASVPGGNFFMLIKTSGPLNVELLSGGSVREKAESVEAGFKAMGIAGNAEIGGRYFDEAHIISPTTQTIRVGISDGNGGYDRALGEVTAEPKLTQSALNMVGYDALTSNNFAFTGAAQVLSVTGEYPHIQLLNPVGSGRVVLIDSVRFGSSVNGVIILGRYDTAIVTESQADGPSYIGGTANIAQLRAVSSATQLGAPPHPIYDSVLANETTLVEFKTPLRVDAGVGLIFMAGSTGSDLRVAFQWREYA